MLTIIVSNLTFYFICSSFGKVIGSNSKKCFFIQFDGMFLRTDEKIVFEVEFLTKCSHICLRYENECKAINFKKDMNDNGRHRHLCEILKSTSRDSSTKLTEDRQWIYLERKLQRSESDKVSHSSISTVKMGIQLAWLRCPNKYR